MSDGMNDARRDSELITAVENAALRLRVALKATGNPMCRVNPAAVRYANAELRESGYVLVREEDLVTDGSG